MIGLNGRLGGVRERSNRAVLKTAAGQPAVGSNPTPAAQVYERAGAGNVEHTTVDHHIANSEETHDQDQANLRPARERIS
jgi:hypothetical protein